jgi:hypothetical protein
MRFFSLLHPLVASSCHERVQHTPVRRVSVSLKWTIFETFLANFLEFSSETVRKVPEAPETWPHEGPYGHVSAPKTGRTRARGLLEPLFGGFLAEPPHISQAVEAALAKARGDAARGLAFDAGNLTVGEWLDRWLEDAVADTVRTVTSAKYEQIVRNHLKPALVDLGFRRSPRSTCVDSTERNSAAGSHPAPCNTSTSRPTRRSNRRLRTA